MKVVIAPDSFKGNMRSSEVCAIIRASILSVIPETEVLSLPMADGGEGTVDAMVEATGGRMETVQVSGPLGAPVTAAYGILPDGSAVMEMAAASGIELLSASQLNPMQASTCGTGELLRHLLQAGHTSIVIGIGGSATVDGGTGMAQALGYRFLDETGAAIPAQGGQALSRIASVDESAVLPALAGAHLQVACDVRNPLTGPAGAAAVFGPQKGATPEMIPVLDAGLAKLQRVRGLEGRAGDGAAGGLGFGLRTFCHAEIVSGARLVAETVHLPDALQDADLLITGEGRTDSQTASGKLCAVLAEMARAGGVKTLLLSGALQGDLSRLLETFDFACSISAGHSSLEACISHAKEDLAFTVCNLFRMLQQKSRSI